MQTASNDSNLKMREEINLDVSTYTIDKQVEVVIVPPMSPNSDVNNNQVAIDIDEKALPAKEKKSFSLRSLLCCCKSKTADQSGDAKVSRQLK